MKNYFSKRPSGAPLHTLSKLYDVPVGVVAPLLWGSVFIGARLMHVGDSSIYLNWLLENIYNKVPNSNSGKNYELF